MSLTEYIVRSVFILLLLTGINIYVPARLSSMFGIKRRYPAILLFFLLFALGVGGIGVLTQSTSAILVPFFKMTQIWIGVIPFLFLFLLVYELVKCFVDISKKKSALTILILSALVTGYGMYHARGYQVYQVDIPLKGLKQEVKIFHIPDIHIGPFRGKKTMEALVSDIKVLEPDFVLINGDIVDGMVGLKHESFAPLKDITCPAYFTGGNHDAYVGRQKLQKILQQFGVKILDNEIVRIKGIQLIGLDYMNGDNEGYDPHASERKDTIKSVIPTMLIDEKIPAVAVHHSPTGIKYLSQAGVDLLLAGHTHGGQMFPATLIAKMQFPYLVGLSVYDKMNIYISQGVGTYGPPIRIGTEGEATLITLTQKL